MWTEDTKANILICFPHLVGKRAGMPGRPKGTCVVRGYYFEKLAFQCFQPGSREEVLIYVRNIMEMLTEEFGAYQELTRSERALIDDECEKRVERL